MITGFFDYLIATVSGGLSAIALIAILHPRVLDGIVIKLGLSFLTVGFGALGLQMLEAVHGEEAILILRALCIAVVGVGIICTGYAIRKFTAGHSLRRRSDWIAPPKGEGVQHARNEK